MKKCQWNKAGTLSIILLLVIILSVILKPVFEVCDDNLMRNIVSGLYTGTPDSHAVFIQYPFSAILSFLYRYVPDLPWYGIIYDIIVTVCLFIVIDELLKFINENKISKKFIIAAIVFLLLVIILVAFWIQQFTVIAGILAATAIFCIMRDKSRVLTISLILIGFWIRRDVILMSIPFLIAAIMYRTKLKSDREALKIIKKEVPVFIMLVVIILGGIYINSMHYSEPSWKEYNKYNNARASLYDYTDILSTDNKYKDVCEKNGITQDEYRLIDNYQIMLDKNIDTNTLKKVKQIINDENEEGVFIRIAKCVYDTLLVNVCRRWEYTLIILVLYIYAGIMLAKHKKYKELFIIISVFSGGGFICLLFTWINRVQGRVLNALFLMMLFFIVAVLMELIPINNRKEKTDVKQKKLCVILSICLIGAVGLIGKTYNKYKAIETDNLNGKLLANYCQENSEYIYIADILLCQGRVFDESLLTNNLWYMGGWMTKSPLVKQKLNELNSEDCSETFYYNDNVYYVIDTDKKSELESYFSKRFGNETKLETVDVIEKNNQVVYQILQIKKGR